VLVTHQLCRATRKLRSAGDGDTDGIRERGPQRGPDRGAGRALSGSRYCGRRRGPAVGGEVAAPVVAVVLELPQAVRVAAETSALSTIQRNWLPDMCSESIDNLVDTRGSDWRTMNHPAAV
jgi:hypothetical protein